MTTPNTAATAQKHPAPAPNAATPNSIAHLGPFSSPAPRSVPSPAAHRALAGKSPRPTVTGAAAIPAHNHPTSSSGRVAGSSPAPGLLSFESPGGLATLAGMEGGVGMGLTMSGMSGMGLGLGSSFGGRGDEEERRRRLEAMIAALASRPGRIGEESLEKLAQRTGFAVLWDPPKNEPPRRGGGRTLTLAGSTVMVDVEFAGAAGRAGATQLPTGVTVAFPDVEEQWDMKAETAARLLKDDLTPPEGRAAMNWGLERFAGNLERLARLDRLSSQNFNCMAAVVGVYKSLRKLYDHEKKALLALSGTEAGKDDVAATVEVICKKHGRPRLNGSKRVGVSLEYWITRRHLVADAERKRRTAAAAATATDAMDIDPAESEPDFDPSQIHSLSIECEQAPAGDLLRPVRISDAWIADPVEKPLDDPTADLFTGSPINWAEPPASATAAGATTAGSAPAHPDQMDLGGDKPPAVRFAAKLHPPVAVPWHVAHKVYAAVGAPFPPEQMGRYALYEDLVVPVPGAGTDASGDGEVLVESVTPVLAKGPGGAETEVRHRNVLSSDRTEFGFVLESVPFSHPKQLLAMLPILRQHILLSHLLRTAFPTPSRPVSQSLPSKPPTTTTSFLTSLLTPPTSPPSTAPSSPPSPPTLPIDITVLPTSATAGTAHLTVRFPLGPRGPATTAAAGPRDGAVLALAVDANAEVTCEGVRLGGVSRTGQTGRTEEDKEEKEEEGEKGAEGKKEGQEKDKMEGHRMRARTVARAMEWVEDVGVLVEWVNARVVG